VKRVLLILLALVLAISLAVVGCAGTPSQQEEEEEEEEEPFVVTEWEIPNIGITTGPGAAFGLDAVWGVERAVEEINDAGGIAGAPIVIDLYDTAFDNAKAVQVMTQALGTDPLVIIGPMDGNGAVAAGDLAVDEGVPFITSLQARELLDMFEPWGCSLYPDHATGSAAGTLEWLRLNPDIESIDIFYLSGVFMADEIADAIEEACATVCVTVIDKIPVEVGQIDFGSQATSALADNVDGYYSMANVAEHALICRELYQRGMTEGRRICAGSGANSPGLFDLGAEYVEDTYIWDMYDFTSTDPGWLAAVDAYKEDHDGGFPYSIAVWGQYEAVYAVKSAIESLDVTGDPEKREEERIMIRDFLWNSSGIPGCQGGTWGFTNGEKINPIYIYQIVNGEQILVSETTIE
jgi:ABC-type branched-subunit amino acid transport system substrate-binding protein